jgi:hypothetical protein
MELLLSARNVRMSYLRVDGKSNRWYGYQAR